jgi:hypothetical protein
MPGRNACSLHDFDFRAKHARTLLPAALASASFGFVLVQVRVPRSPGAVLILAVRRESLDRHGHVRRPLPAALTSESFEFVLVRPLDKTHGLR